jgi:hypothetical protein
MSDSDDNVKVINSDELVSIIPQWKAKQKNSRLQKPTMLSEFCALLQGSYCHDWDMDILQVDIAREWCTASKIITKVEKAMVVVKHSDGTRTRQYLIRGSTEEWWIDSNMKMDRRGSPVPFALLEQALLNVLPQGIFWLGRYVDGIEEEYWEPIWPYGFVHRFQNEYGDDDQTGFDAR